MLTPFNYIIKTDCIDCEVRFPVHENIFMECRCISCQAKWRAKKAKENKEKWVDKTSDEAYN